MALLPLRRDTASGDTLCVTLSLSSRDESGSAPMVPTACVSRGLHAWRLFLMCSWLSMRRTAPEKLDM